MMASSVGMVCFVLVWECLRFVIGASELGSVWCVCAREGTGAEDAGRSREEDPNLCEC